MDCGACEENLETTIIPRHVQEYIEELKNKLAEEHEQKEALSLERAKLKVCWELTLEELVNTRNELTEKITHLESELQKQTKKRRLLQNLLEEFGKNMKEIKNLTENVVESSDITCGISETITMKE